MGYQESLMKVKQNSFDKVVEYLNEYEKELDAYVGAVTVVTFKEDIKLKKGLFNETTFQNGEKCICIVGDRSFHNTNFIFQHMPALSKNSSLVAIEEFQELDDEEDEISTLDKMFKTHELASEISFDKYSFDPMF